MTPFGYFFSVKIIVIQEGAIMKSIRKEGHFVGLLSKRICLLVVVFITNSALAEYYVVYETGGCEAQPPVMYYQTECSVVKHTHKKHKYKHTKKSHYKTVKPHKKSSAVVTVYYNFSNLCGGQCYNNCNHCRQVQMPVCQGCGYKAYYGTPVMHSELYYMQGIDENDYVDPNMDGNTYDNDIYY
jgi:hypothetical protein